MKARPIVSTTLLAICLCACVYVIGVKPQAQQQSKTQATESAKAGQQKEAAKPKGAATASPGKQANLKGQTQVTTGRQTGEGQGGKDERQRGPDEGTASSTEETTQGASPPVQQQQQQVVQRNTNAAKDDRPEDGGFFTGISEWAVPALKVLGIVVLLGSLAYLAKLLIDGSRERIDRQFSDIRRRQGELARQVNDSTVTLSKEFKARLAELQSEIRELRRDVQDDSRAILDATRRAGTAAVASVAGDYSRYAASASRIEEPEFPVPAEDYLSRVGRNATVVKSDFQNGILVQDTNGDGEFVLVRDNSAPDGLLYVVPRVSHFQTKQDFYNYYDKYYECQRPQSGTVWIVEPAVVEKVNGGWTLREKGELEVK